MNRLQRTTGIAAVGIALGLVVVAACRRAPEPPPPGPQVATEAPAASEPSPAPPPEAPGEAIPIEPTRDEATGVELAWGLAVSGPGELRDPVLTFGRGDRVCLAAKVPSAAAGEALLVRWYDAVGAVRGEQSATLAGAPPSAALCLDGSEALRLGSYSLELEVGGRPAGGGAFTVADAREMPSRSGL